MYNVNKKKKKKKQLTCGPGDVEEVVGSGRPYVDYVSNARLVMSYLLIPKWEVPKVACGGLHRLAACAAR